MQSSLVVLNALRGFRSRRRRRWGARRANHFRYSEVVSSPEI